MSRFGRVVGDVLVADDDRALGWREEAAGDGDECALARTGRADERDQLVVADREAGVIEGDDFLVTRPVGLADVLEFERAHRSPFSVGGADGGHRIRACDAAQ